MAALVVDDAAAAAAATAACGIVITALAGVAAKPKNLCFHT